MSLNGKNVHPALSITLGAAKKNTTVNNFTSTDFLGPIRFNSPNGGTSNSRIKKNVNFKKRGNYNTHRVEGNVCQFYMIMSFIEVMDHEFEFFSNYNYHAYKARISK